MVLTNEQINEIITKCAKASRDVRIRDISYIMLCHYYEDKAIAYKCIFGDDGNFNEYNTSEDIKFLKDYMDKNIFPLFERLTQTKKKSEDDITFEENKAYMLKLKKETEDAMANGDIDKKDGLKILADISVKLNDKFSVNDNTQEQLIFVNTKYNSLCECGRELYIPTKEDLMKEYNLIEKE